MSAKTADANTALITALKGINGSTGSYHTNLSNRVYPDEVMPEEREDVVRPYVYVIYLPTSFPDQSGRHIQMRLNWLIVGVVPDTDSDIEDTATVTAISKLHDDIVRALMADDTLGGTVRSLSIEASDIIPKIAGDQSVEFSIYADIYAQRSSMEAT